MTTLHSRKSIDRSRLRSGFVLFTLSAAFALVPKFKPLLPHPTAAIPAATPPRAKMRSSVSPRGPKTRPLVLKRSIATQTASKTRPRGYRRSIAIPLVTLTRPMVIKRF